MDHINRFQLLPPNYLNGFLNQRLQLQIAGFQGSQFPLYKLGCLLNENWLEEDLVNALLELLYFQSAVSSGQTPSSNPPFILLPTLFYAEACHHISGPEKLQYPPNILILRERIQAFPACHVGVMVCNGEHYTYEHYHNGNLMHFDSMGNPPQELVLPVFRWLLDGIDTVLPVSVIQQDVPIQIKAIGSCGIAALSFAAQTIDSSIPQWTDSSSALHRNQALQRLIAYHLVASTHVGVSCL